MVRGECPRCGRPGWQSVYKCRKRNKIYYYLCYVHKVRGPRGVYTKRCLIRRLSEEEAIQLQRVKEGRVEERLRRLEEENRRLRQLLEWFQSGLQLKSRELEAIKKYYVWRKDYSREDRLLASSVILQLVKKGLETGRAVIVFPESEGLDIA